jgi:hypothetical protein
MAYRVETRPDVEACRGRLSQTHVANRAKMAATTPSLCTRPFRFSLQSLHGRRNSCRHGAGTAASTRPSPGRRLPFHGRREPRQPSVVQRLRERQWVPPRHVPVRRLRERQWVPPRHVPVRRLRPDTRTAFRDAWPAVHTSPDGFFFDYCGIFA